MKFGQGWCDSVGEKQVAMDAGFQQHWPQKPNLPGQTSIFLNYMPETSFRPGASLVNFILQRKQSTLAVKCLSFEFAVLKILFTLHL